MQQALRDRLAGLVFVGFGLAFALGALTYDVGSTLRKGPGNFPLRPGGLPVGQGGVIAVPGFVEEDAAPNGAAPWRALFLVLGAVVLFGLTVRGLGLVPSIFLASLLSAFASERTGVVGALVIAAGLTAVCMLVFVVALSLRLPLFGPWLPF